MKLKINIRFIFVIFILILSVCLFKKYCESNQRENFLTKVDLKKKVIVVIMDKVIPEQVYGAISDHTCNKLVNDCTVAYDKDKISTKKKINITNDISLKTSSKKKDTAYIVIYNNKKGNEYNKKFMKKWCNNKNKEKDNYVIIDYDNALMNSHKIMNEITSKLDIKFDMLDLMKFKL